MLVDRKRHRSPLECKWLNKFMRWVCYAGWMSQCHRIEKSRVRWSTIWLRMELHEGLIMTYFECFKAILFHPWFQYVKSDTVNGNGFSIFWYGICLVVSYLLWFIVEVLVMVFLPLSALYLYTRMWASNVPKTKGGSSWVIYGSIFVLVRDTCKLSHGQLHSTVVC